MSDPQIRDAETADLEAITAIHNDAVLNTTAIWNEAVSYTHLTLPTTPYV